MCAFYRKWSLWYPIMLFFVLSFLNWVTVCTPLLFYRVYNLVFILRKVAVGQLFHVSVYVCICSCSFSSIFWMLIHVHCNNTVLCFVCTFVLKKFLNLIFFWIFFSIFLLFLFYLFVIHVFFVVFKLKGKLLNKKSLMCLYNFK